MFQFRVGLIRNHKHCDNCGSDMPLPREAGDLLPEDRSRLEQFFRGGPLYCEACYRQQPPCDDCGMHVEPALFAEHYRRVHPN